MLYMEPNIVMPCSLMQVHNLGTFHDVTTLHKQSNPSGCTLAESIQKNLGRADLQNFGTKNITHILKICFEYFYLLVSF